MNVFTSREFKNIFFVTAAILAVFTLLGQVLVGWMAEEYKQNLIAHDAALAGYLSRNEVKGPQAARLFTAEKTLDDVSAGRELLSAAGYNQRVQNALLPEVDSYWRKFAALALALSAVLSAAVLAALWAFWLRQEKKLEAANHTIRCFMDGDVSARLDDQEEGSLSQLFTSINGMATSLTAHISKEKQSREFLKDTISNISHQLKTPLAALRMYNEIIQEENTGGEVVAKFALKSENELDRMEILIQNLLKLARLDAGAIELEKSRRNLKKFMEKAVRGLSTRAEREQKTLTLKGDDRAALDCDEEWLLEAVSNIIKNALDHTGPGGVIQIAWDESPIVTRISIRDNGSGIHPEDIHYIFNRFYRSRFSKDQQGVGIGLTLARTIVEKHGGAILVESEIGKETTFHLTFPKLTIL